MPKLDSEIFHAAVMYADSPKMTLDGAKLLLGKQILYYELFAQHSHAAWQDAARRNELIENAALPSEEALFRGKKKVIPPITLADAERKIQWPEREDLNEQQCNLFAEKMKNSMNLSKDLGFLLSRYNQATIQNVIDLFEAS